MRKKSSDSDSVAVMPLATSHMPKSEVRFVVVPNVLSRQMNSQHELPIRNWVQSCGGVHIIGLQSLAVPLSQTHKRQMSAADGT